VSRAQELQKKMRAFVKKVGCAPFKSEDYDDAEWLDVWAEWEQLRQDSQPWPKCCAAMREHRGLIYAAFPFDHEGEGGDFYETVESPEKYQQFTPHWQMAYQMKGRGRVKAARPTRCPFCGEKLPAIRAKAVRPEPLCKIEDGGYYCSECKERVDSCICWPPLSAYEIVEGS